MKIGERARTTTMVWQGIRQSHVDDMFASEASYDQVDRLSLPGKPNPDVKISVYLKSLDMIRTPAYQVALVIQLPGQAEPTVTEIARVPKSWLPGDVRPLQVFRELCKQVGLAVRVGNRTDTLIVAERYPLSPGQTVQNLFEVLGPPRSHSAHQLFQVTTDDFVEVVAAYALDTEVFKERLGAR